MIWVHEAVSSRLATQTSGRPLTSAAPPFFRSGAAMDAGAFLWPVGQVVKTPDFQSGNAGSIPVPATKPTERGLPMTRQEFIEEVNSFGDLMCFCQDEHIDICDDIYDADYLNHIILDCVRQMRDWESIRDFVKDIPPGYCFYREDGYGGYEDADYFFNDYKTDVMRYMDNNNAWDEEDEDNDEDIDDDLEVDWQTDKSVADDDIETSSFMAVLGRAS